ncbi:hypothetical protein [Nocardia yamanashiensis]|uniref:hypothetical protein n=1 Tax=Nocardia yamanashiensis TaxID=209247 RepID=UPI00083021D2|nr:hypothetical protein [Nocardia yamanashiensis]
MPESPSIPALWLDGDPAELLTLDVVLRLPQPMRDESSSRSRQFSHLMRRQRLDARFVLGEIVPWGSEPAEPHISIFMLTAPREMLPLLADAVDRVAAHTPPVEALGKHYGHNPFGAPELFFHATSQWRTLQRTVVEAFEPLRQGRLRQEGPFGEPLPAMLAGTVPADPERLKQLRDTGFDEIGDRFRPHVTESAPTDPAYRVPFDTLPAPESITGTLTTLALYRMGPYGTCLTNYHEAELGLPDVASEG